MGPGNSTDYSIYEPFNSASDYHPFCFIDYSNKTSIQVCWEGSNTVSLPDLRTEDQNIRDTWNHWITDLVANYSIDGLRFDSAQQTGVGFFEGFQEAAGDTWVMGEVYNGDPAWVCPYQDYVQGLTNYPAYYWITQAFQNTQGSISNLVNGIHTMIDNCTDTTLLGSFIENHDVARFASLTPDMKLAENAIAFALLADGVPIVYQGQEHHLSGNGVPLNRETIWSNSNAYSQDSVLYKHISAINQIRNHAIQEDHHYITTHNLPVYSDAHNIVMKKGKNGKSILSIFTNAGSEGSNSTLTLTGNQTGLKPYTRVVEVLSCTDFMTNGNATLSVGMTGGEPKVMYPRDRLVGSKICGL
ncbi:hypothetical protein NHQ30_004121 [Ciborinia camelliae]|nr:hypothetical protein NHQ30_004121 [Ciborinia camelliae]